jgi:YidC/Oxa1 family membrane protein insertase
VRQSDIFVAINLSYKSMAVMKKLAPKMQEMKEAYGDNPTKLREEMFKLYQKEGANPMLGCLPMIIQTPVFIALYWSLMESVDLRQAPFYGWIVDLSVQDPYFVLPLLMGASMWVQQKLNPPPADPMQQRIFQFMPIIFTGMFLFFPAGLVLYMLVNNLISMAHQFWIYKSIAKSRRKMILPDRDTIAAIATAPGKGGVGIVRLSGAKARVIGEAICNKTLPARMRNILRFF